MEIKLIVKSARGRLIQYFDADTLVMTVIDDLRQQFNSNDWNTVTLWCEADVTLPSNGQPISTELLVMHDRFAGLPASMTLGEALDGHIFAVRSNHTDLMESVANSSIRQSLTTLAELLQRAYNFETMVPSSPTIADVLATRTRDPATWSAITQRLPMVNWDEIRKLNDQCNAALDTSFMDNTTQSS